MHRVGVRGLQRSYEGKMLPFQDAQAQLSRNAGEKKMDKLGYPFILSFCQEKPKISFYEQDCCMIIPPYPGPGYPFTLEDPPNVPLEDAWYAQQQLLFSCWFRPCMESILLWTAGRPVRAKTQ